VPNDDEAQLVRRASAGDPAAVSALYQRYVDVVFQYIAYRVRDTQLAEDLTAEVFLRAVEGLSDYQERGVPFLAWLYRISHARVVDHWRKATRHPSVPLDDLPEHEATQDDDRLGVDILQHNALLEAMLEITAEQQEVLILRFVHCLSNDEISQIVNKSVGAVKALQRRGLEALARRLKEQ